MQASVGVMTFHSVVPVHHTPRSHDLAKTTDRPRGLAPSPSNDPNTTRWAPVKSPPRPAGRGAAAAHVSFPLPPALLPAPAP